MHRLAEVFLGHLDRWCVAQIESVGQERATVTVRATTLRELIRLSRLAPLPEHATSQDPTSTKSGNDAA